MTAGIAPARSGYTTISTLSRVYGFGSIYGKTVRDSRLAFIIAAGLLGGMALVMGAAVSNIFPTPQARLEVDTLVGSMPASMVNLFGNATAMGAKLGTLGGYMTFKYGAIFAIGTALWSIFALSATLAGEASRGSLDIVAAAPFGKRRIALEKLRPVDRVHRPALRRPRVRPVAAPRSGRVGRDRRPVDGRPVVHERP
jgi:hypothetical protein